MAEENFDEWFNDLNEEEKKVFRNIENEIVNDLDKEPEKEEIDINKQIADYSYTYNFKRLKEIQKLSLEDKKKFLDFFNIIGVGEHTALEGVYGNKFALELIQKKKERITD